ncbi:peptide ABC transporter substrate-binding protein [Roseomonas sp. HJA6]|uniref:Peptide ABC transporter substrate-binding protein n=1 Tax=Roseomonas alba TaxID=2846776 RepID=A0ABS7A9V5_9PROT|nr:ABC transporter substrate-binding protein [Neoroseomonas alba]MBW6399086.1 peptide ABC transporter substrate-binding protein [Neoroseomonas alba]
MTGRRDLLGMGVFAALAAGLPITAARAASDTLRVALSTFPATLRPYASSGNTGNGIKLMIHRGLTSYDPGGELQPELATWTQPSPTEYVFELRDAFFHNGDPVTANDIAYSLNEIVKEGSTAFLKDSFESVERVEVLAPKRIRLSLKRPSATLLNLLASPFAPMISAKSADAPPEEPIGCGPFTMVSRVRGEGFVFRRFPRYYREGQPKIETVRSTYYGDESLRAAAVENGDADLMEAVPWQSITPMRQNPNVRVETGIGGYYYFLFNFTRGRFTDAKLRQAVGLAVDRDAFVAAAFYGHGAPLHGLPIPEGPAFSLEMAGEPFKRDVPRAKRLMAEAGFPNGFSVNVPCYSSVSAFQRAGQVVRENLADIGIEMNLVLADYARYTTGGNRGQYELGLYGATGFYNDPDAIASMLIGPPSYLRSFGFRSERVETLLQNGRAELDPAKRRVIYADLQKANGEEAAMIGLGWRHEGYAMRNNVTGFKRMPYFLTTYSPIQMGTIAVG